MIHIRFVHHRQKLPCVRGQGLDVSSLTFSVKGVKGQRRLAGAGQTGDDYQLVSGNGQIHILQIVGPGTPNSDFVHDSSAPTKQPIMRKSRPERKAHL